MLIKHQRSISKDLIINYVIKKQAAIDSVAQQTPQLQNFRKNIHSSNHLKEQGQILAVCLQHVAQ